jgi:hypothetical protein
MLVRIYAAVSATVCTLYYSDLRICSSRQICSTDIVQFRLAHMQQSLKRRTHWLLIFAQNVMVDAIEHRFC